MSASGESVMSLQKFKKTFSCAAADAKMSRRRKRIDFKPKLIPSSSYIGVGKLEMAEKTEPIFNNHTIFKRVSQVYRKRKMTSRSKTYVFSEKFPRAMCKGTTGAGSAR